MFAAPVDPKRIRPRAWWIAVAWGFALLCVIAGFAVFATGLVSGVSGAAPSKTFAPGEKVTLTIDPAEQPALYLTRGQQVTWECQIGGNGKLVTSPASQTVELNGVSWELIALVNVPAKGDYELTCTIEEQAATRFGLGRDLTSAAGSVIGGVVALFAIPGVGILVAIIWTIVVVVRRNSHRKRLAAGR